MKSLFRIKKQFLLLAFSLLTIVACGDKSKPTFEYMPGMIDSPAVKAQEKIMRTPPEGTVPRNYTSYPFSQADGDLAAQALEETSKQFPATLERVKRGEQVYNIYCIVCHGPTGKGDGFVVPKFPQPPSLLSDKVKNWSNARIYHVVTAGQNLMSSYASQIRPEDRWALVHYVRVLQRAANPSDQDVEELKKAIQEGRLP